MLWRMVLPVLIALAAVANANDPHDEEPRASARAEREEAGGTRPTALVPSVPLKVGFVDWSGLLDGYHKSVDRRKELQQHREEADRETAERERVIARLTNELSLLKKDTEVYFAERKKLMSATSSLRLFAERARATLTRREASINAELFQDIRSAIERLARQNGYIAIFRLEEDPSAIEDPEIQAYRMNTMSLFYSDPHADVTADILELLNREYGRKMGTQPEAAPAVAPVAPAPGGGTESKAGPPPDRPGKDPHSSRADERSLPEDGPGAARRASAVAPDETTALLQQLLEQNRLLNERIARLESALGSNLVALADKVNELDRRAGEFAQGYVADRAAEVTGSVQGRVVWNGNGLADCRVKLVRMPVGNALDALASLFDVGVKPENRRAEFITSTDESGVYSFEAIPTGPYKLHWQYDEQVAEWVWRVRNKPDVIIEPGRLAYCSDVEANIRALN